MRLVRIIASNPAIDISIPMGDGSAYPTAGYGGWTTVARQEQVDATDWQGQAPITEDVPLLLNGLEDDAPVDRQWATVKKLGRDPDDIGQRPPIFKVWGPIDAPEGKAWVLGEGGIEVHPDEIVKRNGDGALLRIEFTLHLLEYIEPATISLHRRRQRRRPDPRNANGGLTAPGNVYVVHAGETLTSIAVQLYGDVSKWRAIGKLNKLHDPHRKLKPGTKLKIPKGWPD